MFLLDPCFTVLSAMVIAGDRAVQLGCSPLRSSCILNFYVPFLVIPLLPDKPCIITLHFVYSQQNVLFL